MAEGAAVRLFHISDILSITTGRLVSNRHIDGVYDILNFLTGDDLFTHQLPRASRECEPWMRTQYPYLFDDNPEVRKCLNGMGDYLKAFPGDAAGIEAFVDSVRRTVCFPTELPEMLPVYEMGADMHIRIDPLEELRAMVGDKPVIAVELGEDDR